MSAKYNQVSRHRPTTRLVTTVTHRSWTRSCSCTINKYTNVILQVSVLAGNEIITSWSWHFRAIWQYFQNLEVTQISSTCCTESKLANIPRAKDYGVLPIETSVDWLVMRHFAIIGQWEYSFLCLLRQSKRFVHFLPLDGAIIETNFRGKIPPSSATEMFLGHWRLLPWCQCILQGWFSWLWKRKLLLIVITVKITAVAVYEAETCVG